MNYHESDNRGETIMHIYQYTNKNKGLAMQVGMIIAGVGIFVCFIGTLISVRKFYGRASNNNNNINNNNDNNNENGVEMVEVVMVDQNNLESMDGATLSPNPFYKPGIIIKIKSITKY